MQSVGMQVPFRGLQLNRGIGKNKQNDFGEALWNTLDPLICITCWVGTEGVTQTVLLATVSSTQFLSTLIKKMIYVMFRCGVVHSSQSQPRLNVD